MVRRMSWVSLAARTSMLAVSAVALAAATVSDSAFELVVLHTNDLHSRFDEVSSRGSACAREDAAAGLCFGGVARIKHAAAGLAADNQGRTIFLNAGDFFQGTVWYSMFKWRVVADLVQSVGYDASSLGNHEFDDGVEDLAKFLTSTKASFPTLAANLNISAEPLLSGLLPASTVIRLSPPPTSPYGRRGRSMVPVGVVGFLTPDTRDLSSVGEVLIEPEVPAMRREVARLREKLGARIVVAVGHSGYEVDRLIAEQVEGVDIVVGGHTNTFLYSDDASRRISQKDERDTPSGEYPTVVTQSTTGKKVLVVQTSGYGKYLGVLRATFDDDFNLIDWSGNPLLLDGSVGKDQDLERRVRQYADQVAEKMEVPVGSSAEFVDGGRPGCRLRECAFGDLVTDAMAEQMDVEIALINSGAIKGSFPEGNLTMGHVIQAMPWANTVDVVTVPGSTLKKILEHSVSEYDANSDDPKGIFLQVSGLVVTYDVNREPGNRLVSAMVGKLGEFNDEGYDPPEDSLRDLEDDESYDVAVLSFMVKGGDGYAMIPAEMLNHRNTGELDGDLLVEYLRLHSPVSVPRPGRIVMSSAAAAASGPIKLPLAAAAVFLTLMLAVSFL